MAGVKVFITVFLLNFNLCYGLNYSAADTNTMYLSSWRGLFIDGVQGNGVIFEAFSSGDRLFQGCLQKRASSGDHIMNINFNKYPERSGTHFELSMFFPAMRGDILINITITHEYVEAENLLRFTLWLNGKSEPIDSSALNVYWKDNKGIMLRNKYLNRRFRPVLINSHLGLCLPFRAKINTCGTSIAFERLLRPDQDTEIIFFPPTTTPPPTTTTITTTTQFPAIDEETATVQEEAKKGMNVKMWIVIAACGTIAIIVLIALVVIASIIILKRKKLQQNSKLANALLFIKKYLPKRFRKTNAATTPVSQQNSQIKIKQNGQKTSSNVTSENVVPIKTPPTPSKKPVKQNQKTGKTKNTETLNTTEGGLQIASDSSKKAKKSTVTSVVALAGTVDEEEAPSTQNFEKKSQIGKTTEKSQE